MEAWSVLGQFAWPITALIVFFVLRKELTALLLAITDRMEQATEVVIAGNVTLKVPESGHPITAEHLPLLHSTFRYPRKDAEYG